MSVDGSMRDAAMLATGVEKKVEISAMENKREEKLFLPSLHRDGSFIVNVCQLTITPLTRSLIGSYSCVGEAQR